MKLDQDFGQGERMVKKTTEKIKNCKFLSGGKSQTREYGLLKKILCKVLRLVFDFIAFCGFMENFDSTNVHFC